MLKISFATPILLIIYNRADLTKRVFDQIKKVRPKQLFIAADGPKTSNLAEVQKCVETRTVSEKIDWDCEVKLLYRETNLGCGRGPAEAITWFFDHVEKGIILEDDCLPDTTFFNFCEALLDRFEHNEKVMHIGGSNFQFGNRYGNGSYYFSNYAEIWGWATWKRAWNKFDFLMEDFPAFEQQRKLEKIFSTKKEQNYWYKMLRKTYYSGEKIEIWDYQWLFSVWKNNGIAITPNQNLVSNIGFRSDATHTFYNRYPASNIELTPLNNIIHPDELEISYEADNWSSRRRYDVSLNNKFLNHAYRLGSNLSKRLL